MPASIISNAVPNAYLMGVDDQTPRPVTQEPIRIPQFLPHVRMYTQRGIEGPYICESNQVAGMYGEETLNLRSPFANHQTVFAKQMVTNQNTLQIERIKAPGAATSTLVLWADFRSDKVTQYEREDDGITPVYDADGNLIPIQDKTVDGYSIKWSVDKLPDGVPLHGLTPVTGDMIGADNAPSKKYPVMALQVSSFGSYGNNIGMSISAPNMLSQNTPDIDLIEDTLTYTFNLRFLERQSETNSMLVTRNTDGESMVTFTLKPGSINPKTDQDLYITKSVIPTYEDLASDAIVLAPFSEMHVYQENIDLILSAIYKAEQAVNDDLHDGGEYLINPFTAKDYEGAPYFAFHVNGPSEGGQLFSDKTVMFASGGSDGEMTEENFNKDWLDFANTYGIGAYQMGNMARYPGSAYIDTGFSMPVKMALGKVMNARRDTVVLWATHVHGDDALSVSEERSVAQALLSNAQLYAESSYYNTGACRGFIVGQSGLLLNSDYNDRLPLSIEIAHKVSMYAGASDGRFRTEYTMSNPTIKDVELFRADSINMQYMDLTPRKGAWDAGLIYCQSSDTKRLSYPAYQSVMADDTSILNTLENVLICCSLEKVFLQSWWEVTGSSDKTTEEVADAVNDFIRENAPSSRFGGKVQIIPETIFTKADIARGTTYHTTVRFYGNNGITAGVYNIEAHRLSDLSQ